VDAGAVAFDFRTMTHRQERRRFLEVIGGASLAGCLGSACASEGEQTGDPVAIGEVAAGNVSDVPSGSLQAVGTLPVALGRDQGGVYAMTLTCSHAGCNMAVDGQVGPGGVLCGCHASTFDANGAVTKGPARRPLVHYAVSIDAAGNITIHGGQTVTAEVRTAVA
jgi:Rieske Fe-S protein